jgi:hypothetical protein
MGAAATRPGGKPYPRGAPHDPILPGGRVSVREIIRPSR